MQCPQCALGAQVSHESGDSLCEPCACNSFPLWFPPFRCTVSSLGHLGWRSQAYVQYVTRTHARCRLP
ncbi:hypothetical protein ANANG_G00231740 [Anguilla anguilla]|uniref:Uncharacterized protein n=1 Tax=Anguilla anguilla TaxID=7936 RepID=A0A9D3LUK9_ANGAN|nr:hypothetical protein ANANG_G00231740 [Anguilla anguilla]